MTTTASKKDRVSPSGPAVGIKLEVTIDHGSIPAQDTLAATATLPAKTARVRDSVVVNAKDTLPGGIVIAGARISAADTVEVTLGNLKTTAADPAAIVYDVLIRRA